MKSFLGNFLKKKTTDAHQTLIEMLVKWDPETATEAELDTMYDKFTRLTESMQSAQVNLKREEKEAEVAKEKYNKKLAILEKLNERKESETDTKKLQEIEEAISELIDELSEMKPEVEREIEEAKEAKEYFDAIKDAVENSQEKIKNARKTLERAKQRMKMAELKELKAKEKETRAKEIAGLTKIVDSTSVALNAMNKKAEEMENKANASYSRATMLQKMKMDSSKNALIQEIEKTMNLEKTEEKITLSEKIKSLKL